MNGLDLSPFDPVLKQSVKSVFDGVNEGTERFRKSFDLLRRFRKRHAEKVTTDLGVIQILGMTGSISLVDLYVSTRFTERIKRNTFVGAPEDPGTDFDLGSIIQAEIDVLPIVEEGGDLLLSGGPGSGKTTFVSALILAIFGKGLLASSIDKIRRIPLHFVLREVRVIPKDLRTLVRNYLKVLDEDEAYPFVDRMLRQGKILLIFDGLDEVTYEKQVQLAESIKTFRKTYKMPPIIVTCRTGGLEVDLVGFRHFELLSFTESDSAEFIRKWFSGEAENKGERLLDALKDNTRVAELTKTPLLLSLVCNLYDNDLELSANRTDLYARCVEVMMVRWDTSRGFRRESTFDSLSIVRRRRIFEFLAYSLSEATSAVLADAKAQARVGEYIEKYDLDAKEAPGVLRELESHHGLLHRPAANCWCFSHTSFEEFFAAEYIVDKRIEIEYLKRNYRKASKREVITFLASLLEDGDTYIEQFLRLVDTSGLRSFPPVGKRLRALALLVNCLSQGVAISPRLRKQANEQILRGIRDAVKLLEGTGVSLYGKIIEENIRISYTYYKDRARKSTVRLVVPLGMLVNAISKCSYTSLLDVIERAIEGEGSYSKKLVCAAALFGSRPEVMRAVYAEVPKEVGKQRYLGHISGVVAALDALSGESVN